MHEHTIDLCLSVCVCGTCCDSLRYTQQQVNSHVSHGHEMVK